MLTKVRNKDTVSFKKRYKFKSIGFENNKIFNKNIIYLILNKQFNMEFLYLYNFKKKLKNFYKLKKKKKKVIFFSLIKNFPITKKSKNSRMGKGKGKFNRYLIRIKKNTKIFKFYGFYNWELKNLIKIFKKKNKIDLHLKFDFLKKGDFIGYKNNFSNFFLKKYKK